MREVADRINDTLATIVGRMPPPGIVENEVTSTFGDEALDDTVEEMVEDVTASLMDSDHVEDVFSEDAVIRRDVFRVVKDTLLSSDRVWAETEEADVGEDAHQRAPRGYRRSWRDHRGAWPRLCRLAPRARARWRDTERRLRAWELLA